MKILKTPVEKTTNIGPYHSGRLKRLGIFTLEDLLYHFPNRYEDLTSKKKLNEVEAGKKEAVEGVVWEIRNVRTRYGKQLTLATINDGTASIECVWFNQTYLERLIRTGQRVGLWGKVSIFNKKLAIMNPEYEFLESNKPPIHTSGLVPIYPETAGVSSKWLRSRIKFILEEAKDLKSYELLPTDILEKHNLPAWPIAIKYRLVKVRRI